MKLQKFLYFMLLLIIASSTVMASNKSNSTSKGLPKVQSKQEQNKMSSRHYGPFLSGYPKEQIVYVETVQRNDDRLMDGETDIAVIITSAKGDVLYRKNIPFEPDTSYGYYPSRVKCPSSGSLLLLTVGASPTAPGYETSGQLFNFDNQGKMVPITDMMPFWNNDGIDTNDCIIQEMVAQGQKHLFAAVKGWSGNFCMIKYHHIELNEDHLQPKLQPEIKEHPVLIDEKYAQGQRKEGIVGLFKVAGKPELGIEKVRVNRNSKIRFLGAVLYMINKNDNPWWLHVNIEGVEGFISEWKQLEIIGLPDAGPGPLEFYEP